MDAVVAEKIAHSLATYAVKGERPALEKTAFTAAEVLANPYVRNALIGAGAGGVVGLMQPKRKLRDVLTYGLLGATAGTGLAGIQGLTRGAEPAGAAGAATKPTPAPMTAKERENALPLGQNGYDPSLIGGASGLATGAVAGYSGYRQSVRNQVSQNRAPGLDGGLLNLYNAANEPNSKLSPASQAVGKNIVRQNGEFLYNTPVVNSKGKTVMVPQPLPPRFGVAGGAHHGPMSAADTALHDDIGRALTEAHKVTKPTGWQRTRAIGRGGLQGLIGYAGGRALGEGATNLINRIYYPEAFAPAKK
jgi:hypothetical protein